VKEHLARERVVARVQGRKSAQHLEDVSVAGEPVAQSATGSHGVLGESAASWRAYRDGRPEPPTVGGFLQPPPGIGTMQRGEIRFLVTLGRYLPICATRGNRRYARAAAP
jgi:hypothetical protein